MNWGNKLVLVFIAFGLFIGYLVYKAINTKYDLVSKDYYKEELKYQEKIDGMNNAAKLSALLIDQDASVINIHLPAEQKTAVIDGTVFFYCITDENKDLHLPLKVDSTGTQQVAKSQLQKGAYKVKVNWQVGKEAYYFEDKLQVR